MAKYIHELSHWPQFVWDQKKIENLLLMIRHEQGRLMGGMESIGFKVREERLVETLTQDVVKSSEIEGEILDQELVRSSVARHLGIEVAADPIDKNIEGVVSMVLDATQKFDQPLTQERLWSWHTSLFPNGKSGFSKIQVGAWRKGPVQVVSGRLDKEVVHFEAPQAEKVAQDMKQFLVWFNEKSEVDLLLKAAIAHLWFVTIHPFDDGNGRIGRAIADLLLARSENSARRFYSLSAQIQKERKGYYAILEKTQKGTLDITAWIEWFLACLGRAVQNAQQTLEKIIFKSDFWKSIAEIPLNARQQKMINKLLDGFEGKLTTTKWAKIAKCSQDTAYRDILELINHGILAKNPGGGRNTCYSLNNQRKSL